MNMDKIKRERGVNFSLSERDVLVALVQKYQNVLENKKSDAATWRQKEAAWESIGKEFNARSGGTYRSSKTLKIKYEGLKRIVRKKSGAIRSELYRTGGGKSTAPPLDPVEDHIKAMITLSTDGLDSVYDSDVLPQQQSQDLIEVTEIPFTLPMETKTEVISQTSEVHEVELEESPYNIINNSEPDVFPSTSVETFKEKKNMQNYDNDIALHDTSSEKCVTTPTTIVPTPTTIATTSTTINRKWDVTSRQNLKSKKHPALIGNLPQKIDDLSRMKMELVQLQKKILDAEIIKKKKEWEYKEVERLQEYEFRKTEEKRKEEEHKWKEEEHKWKEEEHKLILLKLKKELNK